MTRLRGNPQTAQCKHCKMAFTNCTNKPAGNIYSIYTKRSHVNRKTQQTQCHSIFAVRHLNCDFAVIHPLSHEQAFGLMTYSLKCVLCDSQRHSDNKALSGKFGRRNNRCRQVTRHHS